MNKINKKNGSMKTPAQPWQAIISGVGGQGVLFVNRLLAMAAQAQGLDVLVSEVHGMAQRGGSVISHLRAGAFRSPLTPMGQADLLFALEKGEAIRNIPYLAPGGRLVVNAPDVNFLSPEARRILQRFKVEVFCANVDEASLRLKSPVNILLLGAAARASFLPVSEMKLQKIIQRDYNGSLTAWKQGLELLRGN